MALAEILAQVLPVRIEADGALIVRHEDIVASLREVAIAEGLPMVSLTAVLAWDLPLDAALRNRVAGQADTTMLGTVTLVEQADGCADVLLRYNFPVGGLDDRSVQTLVLMVLSGGAAVRGALLGG